ncbi:MAG TPA: hypothetical protein GX717_07570, partial [Clostridiaceae bacterium]|nr:hypothetical protein [Clostridiaceae bacterium]
MRKISSVGASKPKNGKGRFIRFTTILLFIAILAILLSVLTFSQANQLMRDERQMLDTYAANDMPTFRPVSFLSLDDRTTLNGWFFGAKRAHGTSLIILHPHSSNRLPFGVSTRDLINRATSSGYNVLTFDQHHAGNSEGKLSTFGYT